MDPPDCLVKCKVSTWGHNCENTCSTKCTDRTCNTVTGLCESNCNRLSCPSGMYPLKLRYLLPQGFYGENCTLECSSTCKDSTCSDYGYCVSCLPGFEGNFCEKAKKDNSRDITYQEAIGIGFAACAACSIIVCVVVVIVVCRRRMKQPKTKGRRQNVTSRETKFQSYDGVKQINVYQHSYESASMPVKKIYTLGAIKCLPVSHEKRMVEAALTNQTVELKDLLKGFRENSLSKKLSPTLLSIQRQETLIIYVQQTKRSDMCNTQQPEENILKREEDTSKYKFRHRTSKLYAQIDIQIEKGSIFSHMCHSEDINKQVYQTPLATQQIIHTGLRQSLAALFSSVYNKKKGMENKKKGTPETTHGNLDSQCQTKQAACRNINSDTDRVVTLLEDGLQVMCDTKTDGGGWIIFQRRINGNVNFYRGWEEYKYGLGDYDVGEFYLGNEFIHQLTSKGNYELRVDLRFTNKNYFASYSRFKVLGEPEKY
ncbi:hypothetical protein Btru_033682 [Bulinus truncatus]|nr:hypothetical protein Btru_033682 [Bulinus truncatus]